MFVASSNEPHLGEAQEDQSEGRTGVFLRLEVRVGAELIGGVFFGWCDPVQAAVSSLLRRANNVWADPHKSGIGQFLSVYHAPLGRKRYPITVNGSMNCGCGTII
jgi:hypothetical protein